MKIPFYKPALPPYEEIEPDFKQAYLSKQLAPGFYTKTLSEKIKKYLNVSYAIPFSNCSDAMMCLIAYLGELTNKKKVIVPNFTFAATWQAVDWNGLTTILVDTDENGLLDPIKTEEALRLYGKDVLAIFGVHIFGQAAYVKELEDLAYKYRTYLIFDAAHGMGSLLNGHTLGKSGHAEVFSIGTTKTLSAGEGAILTTEDHLLAEAMRRAAMHGHNDGDLDVELRSLNGRIQEINSIIAIHGLDYLEDIILERQQIAQFYINELKDISNLEIIIPRSKIRSSYKDFTIRFLKGDRDLIRQQLLEKGIETKRYYYPSISNLTVIKQEKTIGNIIKMDLRISESLSKKCLSIPFFNGITKEEQLYVVNSLKEIMDKIQ